MIIIVSDKNLILENQLSFVMYVCAKETIKHYKYYLHEIGLTYTQYITMLVLWNGDNIPVNELGKRLYLDSGTITPLLKKLEIKKLVERVRDTKDERNVLIKVTEKGFELKNKVRTIPGNVLSETDISVEEADDVLEKLKSILGKVNKK